MSATVQTTPGYRQVLADREFLALWSAQITSAVGDQVTRLALAALVLAQTGSPALSALAFAVSFLPWLVGGPVLGVLADRYPRRTVMVGCDVGRGLVLLIMATGGLPVWALFVLAGVGALLAPPFEAARGATLPDVLTGELYPVGQSLTMASLQIAQIAGFAIGGLLITLRPGPGLLVVDAATFLISAIVVRTCCRWRAGNSPQRSSTNPARSWLSHAAAGVVVVGRTPELRRLLVVSCLTAAVAVVPEGVAISLARSRGDSALAGGLLCAVLPVGTAIGAVALGRTSSPALRSRLVQPLCLLVCAATAATGLRPSVPVLLVLWLLAGVGTAGLLPANVLFVTRLAPQVRGRALSVAQVCLQVSQGVALACAGALASVLGADRAVGVVGLAGGVALIVLTRGWAGPTAPPWEASSTSALPAGLPVASKGPPRRRWAGGPVWALVLVVLFGAWWLWSGSLPLRTAPPGPLHLQWWSLLPLVVAAQAGVVHFQIRRQAQTVTLCHLPIVLGLMCCSPGNFIVARVAGGLLGMALLRRQRGIKLVLNSASYTLEAVTAVTLLNQLRGWPLPAALYVVMIAADLTSFAVVCLAITLFERRLRAASWLRPLVWLLPINLVATSVALLAAAALWRGPGYLPLLAGVLAGLLAFYRTYSGLRDRHLNLEQLKDLAAAMAPLQPGAPELAATVESARLLLLAERVELWLPQQVVVVAAEGLIAIHTTCAAAQPPAAVLSKPLRRSLTRPRWASLTCQLSYDNGREQATLLARDRLGAVRQFDQDDDRVLAAVGALIAGGLDRGCDRQRALQAASLDPLTGLWTLPEAARQGDLKLAAGRTPGLLVVDVIGLQDVNDSLGHDAGDDLLRLTAQRLHVAAGPHAVTARIGGDEFLALLDTDSPAPQDVVRDLNLHPQDSHPAVELRVRAGYSAIVDTTTTFQQLVRQAQAALAKASRGGTRYRAWSPGLAIDPSRRLRLAGDLQTALTTGGITVVFQPLRRAADLVVVGAEALARWHHPALGHVPPDEFIAIAEHTGLISTLTQVVLRDALRQARAWRHDGHHLRVSVNLSPRTLADPDLVQDVLTALADHQLPPGALLLEITENSLMDDLNYGLQVLHSLRATGIEVAIDDFGTGHSSLAHLRTIPAGEVKLDRSLLTDLTTDPAAGQLVRTTITLCHDLGKHVVAEGIEDNQTADLLRRYGVDLLQGYHLGRPLAAADWDPQLLHPVDSDPRPLPRQQTPPPRSTQLSGLPE